ncbi:hypothetical protein OPT61_g2513 [Boeremia exigua]|uniref:Uncharacterized protein n=1 Tax=Boeremia exigua TaxID=749465 RepID=A0ACC2ILC5_9PLEO|nr:hypothetical protein OPT61_g2513 [Boeremia exigua]
MAIAQKTMTVGYAGSDINKIAASVISADRDATTLALACVETGCALHPTHTLVVGPSTYHVNAADPKYDFTYTQDCVFATSSAVCKESVGAYEAYAAALTTETYEGTYFGKLTATITTGQEKLSQTGSVGASSSAAASQTSTASITSTPESGSAASAGASSTRSQSAPASTGGAAPNIMLFGGGLAGVAAGVFGGLLL